MFLFLWEELRSGRDAAAMGVVVRERVPLFLAGEEELFLGWFLLLMGLLEAVSGLGIVGSSRS